MSLLPVLYRLYLPSSLLFYILLPLCYNLYPKWGQTTRLEAVGLLIVVVQRLPQRPDRSYTVSSRVFYKELEEGTSKIIDVNSIYYLRKEPRVGPSLSCQRLNYMLNFKVL